MAYDVIEKCEIVAAFRKPQRLRVAVAELVALGIRRYDINATTDLFKNVSDSGNGCCALWVWIENPRQIDPVCRLLDRFGGENIHVDDRNAVATVRDGAYNLQAALKDPALVFGSPQKLLASHFAPEVKRDMLERWAFDLRQQESADNEGMAQSPSGNELGELEMAIKTFRARGIGRKRLDAYIARV